MIVAIGNDYVPYHQPTHPFARVPYPPFHTPVRQLVIAQLHVITILTTAYYNRYPHVRRTLERRSS